MFKKRCGTFRDHGIVYELSMRIIRDLTAISKKKLHNPMILKKYWNSKNEKKLDNTIVDIVKENILNLLEMKL